MDHRRLALAFSALILVGTVVLFRVVPKGFIPSEDTGQLQGTTETAEGTSYDAMVEHQRAAAAIVQEDPNIDGFMSSVGGGGRISTVNQGRLIIHLKDRATSGTMSADEVAQSLSRKLAAVPGMRVFIQNPPVLNIGGRSSKSEYQFTLTSSDLDGAVRRRPPRWSSGCRRSRASPTSPATSRSGTRRCRSRSPATARRRSAST